MPLCSLLVVLVGAGVITAQAQESTILNLAWRRPACAVPLPQDLVGLSIEYDRFPDWAGNLTHRNDFSYTLLDNLKQKTGIPPTIRVGGGTQDRGTFDPTLTGDPGYLNEYPDVPENYTSTKQIFPEADSEALGPNFWLGSCNFPTGTKFTWGLNLRLGNATEAVNQVREVEDAFALPECDGVELGNINIGNEPDSWPGDYRPENWTVSDYQSQQLEYFDAINAALGINGRKYRTAEFATYWTTKELMDSGIMQTRMGPFINTVSEHHYQTSSGYSLSPAKWPQIAIDLTGKANVRSNLARYVESVNSAKAHGIPFILGETNTFSGHGQPGVSNSAAAALWSIDYSLQAACIGIATVQFHQGVGYNYSAWEPINNVGINITDWVPSAKRHVMPEYYGYLAVADAVGNSGNAYIKEMRTDLDNLSAYQIWEENELKRIMLINAVPWTKNSTGIRPSIAVTFPRLAHGAHKGFKRLEFASLSVTSGLTWGGQNWENYDGVATGNEIYEKLGRDGSLQLSASSAALVYI